MSFTTIISCISSAIHDSELLWYDSLYDGYEQLILSLQFLKSFVICGKKLRNDASFKQFLVLIEEKLRKNSAELHGISDATDLEAGLVARRFELFANSLLEEIDKWYITMLDSTSLMTSEILDIFTSNLEMVEDWSEEIDPLREEMRFLMSLIHFVTKGSAEVRKDLLAHFETTAINTAYQLFHGVCLSGQSVEEFVIYALPELLQKMKPIDPQVYQMYTRSLSRSKLSKLFLDDDALLPVKNFLDSLISYLSGILCLETNHLSSIKDRLQDLYGKLGSLTVIFKERSTSSFDSEVQEEIVDLVIAAALSICSIYLEHIDVESWQQLEKFNTVLSKVKEMDPQKPTFYSPRTSSYGFVDCLLEKLMELTSSTAESTSKSHVQTIQLELASVKSSMEKLVELRDEQVEVQDLWDRLLEVAFKVERAVDHQMVYPLSDSFSTTFDSIIEDIGNIKADVLKISVKEGQRGAYSHLPSQTIFSMSNEVIGFEDEEIEVFDRVRGGSQHLRLIAIVGMPGVGKTTLAKKVYNHSSMSRHFLAKAWSTVTQVMDKKNVLLDLLKQTCPDTPSEMSEHDLANRLRRSLKGKRYLIFLDDIWNPEAWNDLKDSFPDDTKGSRIIFTSRSFDVAPREILDKEHLILSPLSENDSLKLICSKLFPGQGYVLPPAFHELGMKIFRMCGGLPLAIIVATGVLANAETEAWERILGNFSFLSSEENFRYTLEFSYRHLPDYLRPCFLYFGAFPEDQEVSVWRLLRLWIAEGFVRKSETIGLEDVAKGYLNMLIGRSLIMAATRRSDGGIKTCHIHDLLRDFCLKKAKDENFFHFTKGSDQLHSFSEPLNVRRLLIDPDPEALVESKLYYPHARSMVLRDSKESEQVYQGMSTTLHFFKLLKVLDLEHINVGDVFPSAIEHFVFLSFLAIKGREFTLPSWLANLSNLETLILRFFEYTLLLPDNVWNMEKLKCVYIRSYGYKFDSGCVLPMDDLDGSSVLYELERLTCAVIDWFSMEKQLAKFPNIRKLKCLLSGNMNDREYVGVFVFPDILSKLESLDMSGKLDFGVKFEFTSLTNLKKLTLFGLHLYWEIFTDISNQLPSLEVLKLKWLEFKDEEEYTWEMKSGEFSKLRILHVSGTPIQRWIACDDHDFDCFQELVLSRCSELVELPSCLESIETLEVIEAKFCCEALEDLVMQIEEAQRSWGNEGHCTQY